ncbi:ComEC/Rec2 family competence protein [Cellulomonas sp. PSBB021]|uniref:ComEC/Rec2 family competence protein n=1 Tax=Cellulomonas sp. PSBB021 TaxID=2003551 RepID=UPI000B8D4E9B|nr:ComEC/Rec2 family competence protein [Cellulomonas sp. PSBB021]ASR54896.1 hypothetical protein CBP52_07015 [Cellulomonas sp. PSBB021]
MTVDLRLAPAALGSWVCALLVVRAPPGTALVAAVAAGVVALVVALGPSRRRWDGLERPTWRASVVLALLAAAAVGAAGAAQVGARERGLLPELTARAAVGTVVGRVSAEPVPVRAAWPGAPPRVRWALDVTRVEAAGRASGAVGRVVVLSGEPAAGGPAYGARVQVTGRVHAAQRGAREVALLVASADPVVLAPPRAWDAVAGRVRAHVRGLADPLPGDAAALLPGVTVGDTARVPDDLSDAMRASGLTHLVAVSGAHFALVASLVLAGTAALRAPPRVQAAATVVVAAGMLVLVHPEPSVVRAATMGAVAVLGMAAGRPARSPAALGAAVTVLLVADPWLAAELGFALSVAATAGIVLLGVALTRRWAGRLGHGVAAALAVPVAAQLVCAPLVLVASGVLTPWGVLANVAAAPAVAPATLLGLLAAALAPWWPGGAQAAAAAAGAACWWIGAVARHAAQLPGARLAWVPGTAGVTLLAVVGLALARLLLGRRREVSAASGRLDPCPRPPAPAAPPVVAPAVSAARRRPPA